ARRFRPCSSQTGSSRESRCLLGRRTETLERRRLERTQLAALDRRSRRRRQVENEAEIMQAQQPRAEHFLLVEQVADVRARERLAGGTAAALVQGASVAGKGGVAQVQAARPGDRGAGAAETGRKDAVEHVDPALDHLQD